MVKVRWMFSPVSSSHLTNAYWVFLCAKYCAKHWDYKNSHFLPSRGLEPSGREKVTNQCKFWTWDILRKGMKWCPEICNRWTTYGSFPEAGTRAETRRVSRDVSEEGGKRDECAQIQLTSVQCMGETEGRPGWPEWEELGSEATSYGALLAEWPYNLFTKFIIQTVWLLRIKQGAVNN